MKRNYVGCAICDSSWGNVWAEIDGERIFFCCELCVVQFRALVRRIKHETGWPRVEELAIEGDRRERSCEARVGPERFAARFSFTSEGELLRFERSGVA